MEDSAPAERGNMRKGPKFDDFALRACKFSASQQILSLIVRCGWRDDIPINPVPIVDRESCGLSLYESVRMRPEHASHVPERIFRSIAKYMKTHEIAYRFVCVASPD